MRNALSICSAMPRTIEQEMLDTGQSSELLGWSRLNKHPQAHGSIADEAAVLHKVAGQDKVLSCIY